MQKIVYLFSLLLMSQLAIAFNIGTGTIWPEPTTTLYFVMTNKKTNTAFENAMFYWNDKTMFKFKFINQYADPCNHKDSKNGVGGKLTDCGDSFGDALAVTHTSFDTKKNQFYDADMVFDLNQAWDVYNGPLISDVNGKIIYDFLRVALHELGHVIGLKHTPQSANSIMARQVSDLYNLTQDDIDGVCALYSYYDFNCLVNPSTTPTQNKFISNLLTPGKCLDVAGAPGTANGLPLILWDCEINASNRTDQKWTLNPEGFLVNNISGKCLDVAGAPGTDNGSPITLWDCEYTNPNTDQKWRLNPQGFLINTLSGKCLDIAGAPGTINGLPIILWDCETANPNTDQKWTLN